MKSGDRVFHNTLGHGVVTKIVEMLGRKRFWVDFGYTKQLLRPEMLKLSESHPPPPVQVRTPPVSQPRLTREPTENGRPPEKGTEELPTLTRCPIAPTIPELDARKGVMALRLGQILESQVFQLSVGTERLQASLQAAVSQAIGERPTCLLLKGAWGVGKTHGLMLLQALAKKERMVTSGVVLDGVAASLAEPMPLMEEIVSSFCFPGEAAADSLAQVLRKVIRDGKLPALRMLGAWELSSALERLPGQAFDDPDALHLIQSYLSLSISAAQTTWKLKALGYPVTSLPTIHSRLVAARARAFAAVLRNWAQFSKVVGARGLLVILDELDVEYAATAYRDKISAQRRHRRRELLGELKALSRQKAPLLIALASAPAGAGIEVESDAVEDVRRAMGDGLICLKVPTPGERELGELLVRLVSIYRAAYSESAERVRDELVPRLFSRLLQRYQRTPSSVPRQFVRMTLEAFDLATVGEKSFEEVLGLIGGAA